MGGLDRCDRRRRGGDVIVQVAEDVMFDLYKVVPATRTLELRYSDNCLRIGRTQWAVSEGPSPQFALVGAGPLEWLLLGENESDQRIRAAGLAEQVQCQQDRLAEDIRLVAKRLQWLGISAEVIDRGLKKYVKALARGEKIDLLEKSGILRVSRGGQVELFD